MAGVDHLEGLSPLAPTLRDIGQHGSVNFTRERGGWVARCRFRDRDGVTRRVGRGVPHVPPPTRPCGSSCADAVAGTRSPFARIRGSATPPLSGWPGSPTAARTRPSRPTPTGWTPSCCPPRRAAAQRVRHDARGRVLQRSRARSAHRRSGQRRVDRDAAVLGQHPAHDPLGRQRHPPAGRPGRRDPGEPDRQVVVRWSSRPPEAHMLSRPARFVLRAWRARHRVQHRRGFQRPARVPGPRPAAPPATTAVRQSGTPPQPERPAVAITILAG